MSKNSAGIFAYVTALLYVFIQQEYYIRRISNIQFFDKMPRHKNTQVDTFGNVVFLNKNLKNIFPKLIYLVKWKSGLLVY